MEYEPQKIEPKWQNKWKKEKLYKAQDFSEKPKKYVLLEFPYPSGEGLHVGHCRSYSALDTFARKKRMEGDNVLFPMGWDAFGLPAENYALRTGTHPKKTTAQNIANFKKQFESLGMSFDWSREINTTDPKYYKWTQWIFLKLFEKGLAYQAEMPINWCPSCKIGLANEEVVQGKCERCGATTEKKVRKQWMLKITAYADRLIKDLEKVDYPERVKTQQINWIGRSEGASVKFKIVILNEAKQGEESRNSTGSFVPYGTQDDIEVFTTRPDTLFGCTYLVVAPEHEIIENLKSRILNLEEVKSYIKKASKKSDLERTELIKEKTGVELKGIKAINPVNNEEIPIWMADYVLPYYGTGAIMAVPAHDARDYDFAVRYDLPIKKVIIPRENKGVQGSKLKVKNYSSKLKVNFKKNAYEGEGILVESGRFSGIESEKAKEKITKWLKEKGVGKKAVNYKLRDWVFSRQHYWGEPIPLIHCEKCGVVPVPEKDLPVELPYVEKYEPTGTGESPLANVSEWVDVKCPKCGGQAKRETDTMPNWAGSSWYFMRYIDSQNDKVLADPKKLKYWMPVDWYNGGMEHTTLHLLYSRFWYKFLFDIGVAPQDEPYKKRTSHGIVLAEDGRKMSKSFGNVINPDDIVRVYGADSLRLYEMFMGPFEQTISWSMQGVVGMKRFLEKVWKLSLNFQFSILNFQSNPNSQFSNKINRLVQQTIKKVTEDIDNFKFNTAISALMILANEFEKENQVSSIQYQVFLKLLSPFAPHITEELWEKLGRASVPKGTTAGKHKKSIFLEEWPKYDPKLIKEEKITLIVQINGRVRDKIEVERNISEEAAKKIALSREKVIRWTKGKEIKKVIFVSGKLLNIVC